MSDNLLGEGAFTLCNIRKGNENDFEEFAVTIFSKGNVVGHVTLTINFKLDPSGINIPFIKAPNTKGKLVV